ncbi:histidine phosphatase family protein [Paenibacillus sp. UNC451MF]|uniref:histidine phosphatase family protein n=1 Tax=Paenibacillus sp. UNC451MF TaxID=1449063 RepID=UPI0009DD1A1D|nr:histidine phosphatase family protein [Paenibacillus sp. UNC451MF]
MKRIFCKGLLTLLLLFPLLMGGPIEDAVKAAPISPTLLDSLRQGGYILYVRHGEATTGEDQPDLVFNDCSTQRNLSRVGERQAADFGRTIRYLQIPVQIPILASPFCRTKETAQLAFGQGYVQVDPFWINIYNLGGHLSPEEQNRILNALTKVLEKEPPVGANQVIVSHSFPQGVGLGDIPNLSTVIIKPKGPGKGYEVVGRVDLAELMNIRIP